MTPHHPGNGPENNRENQDGQDKVGNKSIPGITVQKRRALKNNGRKADPQFQTSASVFLECNAVLAVHFAIEEWPDFTPLPDLSVVVLKWEYFDVAIGVRHHMDFFKAVGDAEEGVLRPPACHVIAGNSLGVICRLGESRDVRPPIRKIAVHKVFPQRAARADLAFSRRIIRNEESHACIQHQMKVAVEVDGVATVPDDSMSVAVLLIESQ